MLFGIVARSASTRAWLWAAPLVRALEQGRPCVLVSPLSPEATDFDLVLRDVPGKGLLLRAVEDGRLRVLSFQGDFAINLCRLGAAGFVRELDAQGLELETVIAVDQADELFSTHDSAATLQQAATYRHWALPRGHTFVLGFLNVTPSNPLLGGNQAALSYFAGLADASMGKHGLVLQAEFWESNDQVDAETLAAIGAWPEMSLRVVNGRHASASQGDERSRALAWYVGPPDAALLDQADQVQWEVVDSLQPLFASHAPERHAVLVIDRSTNFDDFLCQLQSLRSRLGSNHKIVLRESGFRLREFPQRAMLKAAGADAVISQAEPLANAAALLRDLSSQPIDNTRADDLLVKNEELQTLALIQLARGGRLPLSQFIAEVEEVLSHGEPLQMPCTLAEIPCTQEAGDGVLFFPVLFPEATTRPGDLSTSAAGVQLYFLKGCRQHDAVKVIERVLHHGEPLQSSDRLNLYSGFSAVRSRLKELTAEEPAEGLNNRETQDARAKAEAAWRANASDLPAAVDRLIAQAAARSRRSA